MAFPQLLRRSNFASFDPAITRVYTSTPHSSSRYGDWGLKVPIRNRKGPRYIKVTDLDAGRLLGSDWRSAESEARFIQIHGTGRVPWKHHEDEAGSYLRSNSLIPSSSLYDDTVDKAHGIDEPVEEPFYADNVNAMTPKKFNQYLDKVRTHRGQFLKETVERMIPRAQDTIRLKEDKTWINLAVRGMVSNTDTGRFQDGLTQYDIQSPKSTKIHSTPHRLYGLNYSQPRVVQAESNPLMYQPGRALDPAGASSRRPSVRSMEPNRNEGTNRPWVVSMGGLAATSSNPVAKMSDSQSSFIRGVDFTRDNPDQGQGVYRISNAVVQSPPSVVKTTKATQGKGTQTKRPLDTFNFNIQVQPVSPGYVEMTRELGTKMYVGHNRQDVATSAFGGLRAMREAGAVQKKLLVRDVKEKMQEKAAHQEKIRDVLKKLAAMRVSAASAGQ